MLTTEFKATFTLCDIGKNFLFWLVTIKQNMVILIWSESPESYIRLEVFELWMAILQRHMAKWIRDCNEDVSMPKQACLLKYFDDIRRKKIRGVYIRIWSYKKTNRMKEEIGAHSGPEMEIWLVALVLGSSIVFRKEPSRLLGSVWTAAGQPVNIWMGSETSLTLNFLTLHIWLGVGSRWSSLLL